MGVRMGAACAAAVILASGPLAGAALAADGQSSPNAVVRDGGNDNDMGKGNDDGPGQVPAGATPTNSPSPEPTSSESAPPPTTPTPAESTAASGPSPSPTTTTPAPAPAPSMSTPSPSATTPAPPSEAAQPPTPVKSATTTDALSFTVRVWREDTNHSKRPDAKDTLVFTFVVKNTSSGALKAVAITTKGMTVKCPATEIAAGQSMICTARRLVSQADMDQGKVAVVSTVTAIGPYAAAIKESVTTTFPLPQQPRLQATQWVSQTRDRNRDGRIGVGDGLTFRMTVTNTGNLTLRNLEISDTVLSRLGLTMTCSNTTLVPGQKTWCQAGVLNVTKGMAARGSLSNWATPKAASPAGAAVTGNTTKTVTAIVAYEVSNPDTPGTPPKPRVVRKLALIQYAPIVDDVNGNGALTAGETIRFSFTVTNTGTIGINRLYIDDARVIKAGGSVSCRSTSLAPGASTSCFTTAVPVTKFQGKLGNGFGANYATAVGTSLDGRTVRSNSTSVFQGYMLSDTRVTSPKLPSTGGDAGSVGLLGLALVGLGGATVAATTRRRADRS